MGVGAEAAAPGAEAVAVAGQPLGVRGEVTAAGLEALASGREALGVEGKVTAAGLEALAPGREALGAGGEVVGREAAPSGTAGRQVARVRNGPLREPSNRRVMRPGRRATPEEWQADGLARQEETDLRPS